MEDYSIKPTVYAHIKQCADARELSAFLVCFALEVTGRKAFQTAADVIKAQDLAYDFLTKTTCLPTESLYEKVIERTKAASWV